MNCIDFATSGSLQKKYTLAWRHSANGAFDVHSAFNSIASPHNDSDTSVWRRIWSYSGLPKVRTFLWLLNHDRIVTMDFLYRRHISSTNLCPFQCGVPESTIHCIRDCVRAREVWSHFVHNSVWDTFYQLDLKVWIESNLKNNWGANNVASYPWSYVFGLIAWNIWVTRCRNLYGRENTLAEGIIHKCHINMTEWDAVSAQNTSTTRLKNEVLISWAFPAEGWCTFNTDGSCWSNGNATCGGVLRESTGKWVIGFAHNLGDFSITFAELSAIWDAVLLAKRLHLRFVNFESDSLVGVKMIKEGVNMEHPYVQIVNRIRSLLFTTDWTFRIYHIFREANGVADGLANLAHSLSMGLHEFENCPHSCVDRLRSDCSGAALPRLVA